MSTKPTSSPIDAASIRDVLERALAAGVTPAEIAALILPKHLTCEPARCPECLSELVTAGVGTLHCTSCGVRVGTGGSR
jgi:hypothetical protein